MTVTWGFATRDEIEALWRTMAALADKGVVRPLAEVLVARGVLTPEQLDELNQELERRGLRLPGGHDAAAVRHARTAAAGMAVSEPEAALEAASRCVCEKCGEHIVEEAIEAGNGRPGEGPRLCARCRSIVPHTGHIHRGYRIEGELGAGRAGTVYRARSLLRRCDAALKIIPASAFRKDVGPARFQAAAASALRYQHERIAAVLDSGRWGQDYYLAAEYVPGQPLDSLLASGRYRVAREAWQGALRVMHDLVEAICFAHDSDLVHGELRPRKVLVQDDGRATLADLGLRTGRFFETPPPEDDRLYVAPELESTVEPDISADMYAAGVIFAEMFLGRKCATDDVPRVCAEQKWPRRVGQLLHGLTCPDPDKRWRNPRRMRAMLWRVEGPLRKFFRS